MGDAERDQAIAALTEHYVAGRLDLLEFEERTAAALAARTRDDLETTLLDLPVAASSIAGSARRRRRLKLRLAVAAACVSLAVGVAVTGGDSGPPQLAVPVCPPAAVAGPEPIEC